MNTLANEGDIITLKHPTKYQDYRLYYVVWAIDTLPNGCIHYIVVNTVGSDRLLRRISAENHYIEGNPVQVELSSWQALQANTWAIQNWQAIRDEARADWEWMETVRYAHDGQDIIDTEYEIGVSGNMRQRAKKKLAELGEKQRELCKAVQCEVNEYMATMEVVA